jgi:hypothetical protein
MPRKNVPSTEGDRQSSAAITVSDIAIAMRRLSPRSA